MTAHFLPKPKTDQWTGCMSDDPPALQPVPVADKTPDSIEEAVAWLIATRNAQEGTRAGFPEGGSNGAEGEG